MDADTKWPFFLEVVGKRYYCSALNERLKKRPIEYTLSCRIELRPEQGARCRSCTDIKLFLQQQVQIKFCVWRDSVMPKTRHFVITSDGHLGFIVHTCTSPSTERLLVFQLSHYTSRTELRQEHRSSSARCSKKSLENYFSECPPNEANWPCYVQWASHC